MKQKHMRILPVTGFMLFLILLTGCSQESFQSFTGLFPLRDELVRQFDEQNIRVTIQNGNTVGVSFINSSFNNLSQQEKELKAREVAVFVKDNYDAIDSIDNIWISFVIHKRYLFLVNYTNSLATFFFDKNALEESVLNEQGAPPITES
jgi:hypothetical protein